MSFFLRLRDSIAIWLRALVSSECAVKPTGGHKLLSCPEFSPAFRAPLLISPLQPSKPFPNVVSLGVRDELFELLDSGMGSNEHLHATTIANNIGFASLTLPNVEPFPADWAGEELLEDGHVRIIVNKLFQ